MRKRLIIHPILLIFTFFPFYAQNISSEAIPKSTLPVSGSQLWKWKFDVLLYPNPSYCGEAVYVKLDLLALDTTPVKHDISVTTTIYTVAGQSIIREHGVIPQGKDRVIEVVPANYQPGAYTIKIEGKCPTLGKSVTVIRHADIRTIHEP